MALYHSNRKVPKVARKQRVMNLKAAALGGAFLYSKTTPTTLIQSHTHAKVPPTSKATPMQRYYRHPKPHPHKGPTHIQSHTPTKTPPTSKTTPMQRCHQHLKRVFPPQLPNIGPPSQACLRFFSYRGLDSIQLTVKINPRSHLHSGKGENQRPSVYTTQSHTSSKRQNWNSNASECVSDWPQINRSHTRPCEAHLP